MIEERNTYYVYQQNHLNLKNKELRRITNKNIFSRKEQEHSDHSKTQIHPIDRKDAAASALKLKYRGTMKRHNWSTIDHSKVMLPRTN